LYALKMSQAKGSSIAGSDIGTSRSTGASIADRSKLRVNPPDTYEGNRRNLDNWLLQLDLFFNYQAKDTVTKEKAIVASTYLRGEAFDWIKPFLDIYLEGCPDKKEDEGGYNEWKEIAHWLESWIEFKLKVRSIFGVSDATETAVRKIQDLRQVKSAAQYAATFQQIGARTNWDDNALMAMFRKGLKDGVKDELMRYGGDVTTLDELVQAAIGLDDKLYNRAMEKRRRFPEPRKGYYGGTFGKKQPRTSQYSDPMELDTLEKGRKGKQGRKQEGAKKKNFSCYACGKPGHMARDCRSKGMVPRPQLNVLERESPTTAESSDEETLLDDEWEDVDTQSQLTAVRGINTRHGQPTTSTESLVLIEHPTNRNEGKQEPYQVTRNLPTETLAIGSPSRSNEGTLQNAPKWAMDNSIYERYEDHVLTWEEGSTEDLRWRCNIEWERLFLRQIQLTKKQWSYVLDGQKGGVSTAYDYWMDYRSHNHDILHYTVCEYEECNKHYQAKRDANWTTRSHKCPEKWRSCTNDFCAYHLIDKQLRGHFPGHDLSWNNARQMDLQEKNRYCGTCYWQTCLVLGCKLHYWSKLRAGITTVNELQRPQYRPCPSHNWNSCRNDQCWDHLVPKRVAQLFPGQEPYDAREMCKQARPGFFHQCTQNTWETCLNERCATHHEPKRNILRFMGRTHESPNRRGMFSGNE
jgi:hypothetical protein